MDGDTTPKQPTDGQNLYRPDEPDYPATKPEPADAVSNVDNDQPVISRAPVSAKPMHSSNNDGRGSDAITWSASEFIAHQKSAGWYALLFLGAVVIAAVVWLFTRDVFPSGAVFVGVLLLAIYASQQPRQQTYQLDNLGLTIGARHLPYHDFRSFSVMPEGAFLSIELTPLKRFAMYTTVYLDPADEERILYRLSDHLPMEEPRQSLADSLMRRIHF